MLIIDTEMLNIDTEMLNIDTEYARALTLITCAHVLEEITLASWQKLDGHIGR